MNFVVVFPKRDHVCMLPFILASVLFFFYHSPCFSLYGAIVCPQVPLNRSNLNHLLVHQNSPLSLIPLICHFKTE